MAHIATPQDLALFPALFLRRYKRFLADIRIADGRELTLHCPNTGSMKNCLAPETPCWYSISTNAARKYPHTLEIVTTPSGHLAGINTSRANDLVERAINAGVITELRDYPQLRREVMYGSEKSRVDFVLENAQHQCFVEVKNVTLMEAQGQGYFPDAVSERGTKHLRELMQMVAQGQRALLFFCVQHTGIECVEAAAHIDPLYARTLADAVRAGVEVVAYAATINPERSEIFLAQKIPVKI